MKIGDTVIVRDNILEIREVYSWNGSGKLLKSLIGNPIIVEDFFNNIIVYKDIYIPLMAVYTLAEYRALKIKEILYEEG